MKDSGQWFQATSDKNLKNYASSKMSLKIFTINMEIT